MKKYINTIFYNSLIFFVLFVIALIFSQYLIITKGFKPNDKALVVEFINKTEDIEKLKVVALLLAESDRDYNNFLHDIIYDIRIIFLGLSILAATSLYSSYKARKNVLTK